MERDLSPGHAITLSQALAQLEDMPKNLEDDVTIPYVLKNQRLMKVGNWNNLFYSSQVLSEAYNSTDWNNAQSRMIYLDHPGPREEGKDNPGRYLGEARNLRWDGDGLYGDVVLVDKPIAMKIHFGAQIGYSPEFIGDDYKNKLNWARYKGFALVLNPAVAGNWVKGPKGYLNSAIVNVYFNSINKGDKMTENVVQETKNLSHADEAFNFFSDKYKEEHPKSSEFEVKSEFDNYLKKFKESLDREKPKKPEPVEPVPVAEPVAPKMESPTEDKEARDQIKALEEQIKLLQAKPEPIVEPEPEPQVPKKMTTPAPTQPHSPIQGADDDERFYDWLQKNVIKIQGEVNFDG